jgi:hypothetical protein
MQFGRGVLHLDRHDNGWTTYVTGSPDGTFQASAAPAGSLGLLIQYVEMDEPTAKAAALYSLAEKTGHSACSDGCSGWELHTRRVGSHPMEEHRMAKKGTARKRKSTARTQSGSQKRERINTGTDVRYVKRTRTGQFKESDDVGRSQRADRAKKAKRTVKSRYGDQGDRPRRSRKR